MSPERKLARVLVRLDHVARFIVNVNHSVVWTAVKLGVIGGIADCVRLAIPQPTVGRRSISRGVRAF